LPADIVGDPATLVRVGEVRLNRLSALQDDVHPRFALADVPRFTPVGMRNVALLRFRVLIEIVDVEVR
jgi:hypothetical protein